VDRQDVFLYHKTTRRQLYEAAKRACPDCDDVLLWNDRGEVTETCTGNVALALERDGHLVTPPVECGLLRGTYRSWLMTQGRLQEGVVRLEECVLPHRLYVMNSVHGLRQAVLFP
jgi:para-aminobenzoate synthetase/4-amino-4-deoxychorismate lyase